MSKDASVIRIKPYYYIHVLDNNSNVTRIEVGPSTFTRQEHEKVVFGPEEMTKIPPRNYVIISNPVIRNPDPLFDDYGNPKLKFGDEEIRFDTTFKDPFPLFPGESISGRVSALPYVGANNAIRLKAVRDCVDENKVKKCAGEEWIIKGPRTYYPQVEVKVVQNIVATIIKENQAIRLKATRATQDSTGVARKAGEEWLIRSSGAYLPGVDEEIVNVNGRSVVNAIVLTEKKALHLKAVRSYIDIYKKKRRAGEQWLVTLSDSSTHIPDVCEELVGEVKITTLSNRQYCVVLNPLDAESGKNKLSEKELRVGEASFFLKPGEKLEKGIQDIHVLGEDEALLLTSRSSFKDESCKGIVRKPGERWMLNGPTDYVPPVEVEIVEKRRRIPLDENEGIYVRDMKSGRVRSVCGHSYMLESYEELWEKPLSSTVEELIAKSGEVNRKPTPGSVPARDKSRLVTYRAPHNSAVQVYDFREKTARVVFGPGLVSLGPDEQFTLLTLSGSTPKKQGVIKSICLLLGPDFMTDVVIVETCDHARLALQLAYNWQFNVKRDDPKASSIFAVPDFVGDACKAIASRVRGSVASCSFDYFHRNSAEVIRTAVFGKDVEGNVKPVLNFNTNLLVVTGIDIQSVEPVDERTRDSLQKSVQLAIEITTNSQEAEARRESEKLGQEAKGQLEIQRITNEVNNEKERKHLLTLQAQSANVEATGQAIAEAQAKADATEIESQAAVKQAQLKAEAKLIESRADLEHLTSQNRAEVTHLSGLNELEVEKAREMSLIETKKFAQIVNSLGADTIQSMAQAGPELQAKLLSGLGLKSFMITDGNSPINLFNTANGLIGGPAQTQN